MPLAIVVAGSLAILTIIANLGIPVSIIRPMYAPGDGPASFSSKVLYLNLAMMLL